MRCASGVRGSGKRTNTPPLEFPPSVRPSRNWSFSLKSPYGLTGYQSMPSPSTGVIPPEPSVMRSKCPLGAWAHCCNEIAVPSKICSSWAEYVCHGPPSMRYCVSVTPEPFSPSCGASVTRTGPSAPDAGSSVAAVAGAALSTRRRNVCPASTLASSASSVAKYSTVCSPAAWMRNGPV